MEYALAILFSVVMVSAILSVAPLTWPEIKQPSRRSILRKAAFHGNYKLHDWVEHREGRR